MAAKRLRVATEADAAPKKPMTLSEAVESGSYLDILMAQRRQMVVDVKDERGPARAALHRQVALHSKEIAALLELEGEESSDDDAAEDEAFEPEAL